MHHGFLRVAAISPEIKVADPAYNAEKIVEQANAAANDGAKLIVFPEMCLTGYTCGDLFLMETLQKGAISALKTVAEKTAGHDSIVVVGLPLAHENHIYNCAAVLQSGRVLGVVPKMHLPNYQEFYELRQFSPGFADFKSIRFAERDVPFSANLIFRCRQMEEFTFALEICEDLWVPSPTGEAHALAGAMIIVNPSASDELAGKAEYRQMLIRSQSARLVSGYIYAGAGMDESTQDIVFGGHNMIAENGVLLCEAAPFSGKSAQSEIDLRFLRGERRAMNGFREDAGAHLFIDFDMALAETKITRAIDPTPFVPNDSAGIARRAEEILSIQAHGLRKRILHTGTKHLVLGVSGGLDSTLALIVAARALKLCAMPPQSLVAATMPCFGTTGRTRSNAEALSRYLGADFREINIEKAVTQHLFDVGIPLTDRSVSYENAQARERTQVLMDLANKLGGLVIGTGDLSELALGWATYNGDHMSMYAVNSSVPKTLIRYLVSYAADTAENEGLRSALLDVLDTPVSPELLPPENGEIAQKTEDLVGPYELHDFFLYRTLRRRDTPEKVLRLAYIAFAGKYEKGVIDKWFSVFAGRFFAQQFKRSCMPDGPKVGSVSLSPRGDWRMPSDAAQTLWQR